MAEKIPGFDVSDYRVECTPTSENGKDFVIDYTKKTGAFITDSGYTVIFQNGRADRVYDNTVSAPLSLRFAARSGSLPPQVTGRHGNPHSPKPHRWWRTGVTEVL